MDETGETYEGHHKDPPLHDAKTEYDKDVSVYAYYSTGKGLLARKDGDSIKTSIVRYKFRGEGDRKYIKEENWSPELDLSTMDYADIISSMEIFVLLRNFPRGKFAGLLDTDLLGNLAPILRRFSTKIKATDPEAIYLDRLLIDDILNTDEDEKDLVLFLRLGQRLDEEEESVSRIKRTSLYRLNVASGEVFKYTGDTVDYSLAKKGNWKSLAKIAEQE